MTKVLSFINAKGGVGKTTNSVNIAGALSSRGHRVLLIDLDAQGNSTQYIYHRDYTHDISDLLLGRKAFPEVVLSVEPGLDLIPLRPTQDKSLSLEQFMVVQPSAELTLITALEDFQDAYDYIVIDCPPGLGKLGGNALVMSDLYIVPMLAEAFSLHGVETLHSFAKIMRRTNPGLRFGGYVLNRYNNKEKNNAKQVVAGLVRELEGAALKSVIREDVTLQEALLLKTSHTFNNAAKLKAGIRPESNSVADFSALCDELLHQLQTT